jgi:hypothetical protein
MGDHPGARLVTVQMRYESDGAPEYWTPSIESATERITSVTLPPRKAIRSSRTR